MGKHDFLTPKAIANRIKAKGLQKLRWYCQMCQKQCRDENGFKCHCLSESHARQMEILALNPGKFEYSHSQEFESGFLQICRLKGKRVKANTIYQEYISDRNHVHMNGTRWSSLTGFVKYLGKTGKCRVDQTEKGWFIEFINRDPKMVARQEAEERNAGLKLTDEEITQKMIARKIELAKKASSSSDVIDESQQKKEEFKRNGNGKVSLSLRTKEEDPKLDLEGPGKMMDLNNDRKSSKRKRKDLIGSNKFLSTGSKKAKKASNLELLKIEIDNRKLYAGKKGFHDAPPSRPGLRTTGSNSISININSSSANSRRSKSGTHLKEKEKKKNWICRGIVVRVLNDTFLGGKYNRQKGTIMDVENKFCAKIKLKNGDVVKFDQAHLQTVLPSVDKKVMIVNGEYRRCKGKLVGVNPEMFEAEIKLDGNGDVVRADFDLVCKVDTEFLRQ